MSEPGTADLIADLLLRHYREPMRYRGQAPREAHALGHLNVVLRLARGRPVELSDPTLRGLGAAAELERAAAFYIQQNFFREGASHYEVLGLAPDAASDSVRENFRLLMQLIHPDRHGGDTGWPEGFAARANGAYSVLKGAQTRADYDRQQAAARAREAATRAQQSGRHAPASGVRTSVVATAARVPAGAALGRRPLPPPTLPVWLTAGVGGFVLRHPAFTAFAGLIAVSALIIGAAISPEHENALNAESAYTVPEPVKRGIPNRPRATELPAMERVTGLEPRVPVPPLTEAAPAPPVSMTPGIPARESAPVAPATPELPMRSAAETIAAAQPIPAPVAAPVGLAARAVPAPAPVGAAAPGIRVEPAGVAVATPAPATDVARPEPLAARVVAAPVASPMRVAEMPPSDRAGPLPPSAPTAPLVPAPITAMSAPQPAIAALPAPAPPPAPPPAQSVATRQAASPPGAIVSNAAAAIPAVAEAVIIVALPPPGTAEVETLIAAFISSYESGRLSAFAGLFHDDAQANQQRGRAAIVGEYDQLFRSTISRRMSITQMRWQAVGDRTEAKGELMVKTSWRDGREAEQRVAVDMELVRQGGRAVISKLGLQPR